MTNFGENIEYIDDDPVNLMVPSDLTKTVSILNYRPPKFQSYEKLTSQTRKNTNLISTPNPPISNPNTIHKIVIKA